jgi:hypothetical protein
MILTWSWVFIHKTNDISRIFNGGNETVKESYFVDGIWIYMIFLQWTYFTLESHEISSQELWLNAWRVMTEGPSIHQHKFMNDIARMFMHGTYIKLHGQTKLWMHFCGWNKTLRDISWIKMFHFQTKLDFVQLFHSSTMNFI